MSSLSLSGSQREQRRRGSARELGPLLALACCSLVACSSEVESARAPAGQGVLVIAIDALRADHIASLGHDRDTMPALDGMMEREGFQFSNVWTPGPEVVPAHIALLTGCDPAVGRQPPLPMEDGSVAAPLFNWIIPPEVPRLAEEFLAHGWMTGGFVDHATIAGLRGFRQGFRDYVDAGGESGEQPVYGFEGVAGRFVEWVKGLERERNWFAYLHLNDLERLWGTDLSGLDRRFRARPGHEEVPPCASAQHVFFAVPRSRFGAGETSIGEYLAIYDAALSQLDRKLVRLFGVLQTQDRWKDTTIVVVGSYGFGFGESGLTVDGGTLSPVDLHVPLFLRPAPGLELEVGARLDVLASLIDLAPTLLDLQGLEARPGMHGRSLAPLLRGGTTAQELTPKAPFMFASHGAYGGFAVTDGSWLLQVAEPGSRGGDSLSSSWFGDTRNHRGESFEVLYDLRAALVPGRMERGVEDPARSAELRAAALEWYEWMSRLQHVLHHPTFGGGETDPAELAELRRRGLIGALD